MFPSDLGKYETSPFTIYKKRTYLQGQITKAKVQMREAFDYLIGTKPIEEGKIVNIDNEEVSRDFPLIPNE